MNEKYEMDVAKSDIDKLISSAKNSKDLLDRLKEYATRSSQTDDDTNLRKQMEAIEASAAPYAELVQEIKEAESKGKFVSGFKELDELLYFSPGDLVIVQSMSNHGKTSLMGNLAYQFLKKDENANKNPIILSITYESSARKIKQKFVNTISSHVEGKRIIYMDRLKEIETTSEYARHRELLFGHNKEFKKTIETYDGFVKSKSLFFLQNIPLESLQTLVGRSQKKHPGRPLILFLDYFQIIRNSLPGEEGWQKIKQLAYWIERFAIDNDIIVFAGSQVNEQGDPREGKDIYNAATIVLDLFNHSHPKLKDQEKNKTKYREKINGRSVVTMTIDKAKEFECRELKEYLLFDGNRFDRNPSYGQAEDSDPSGDKVKRTSGGGIRTA